MKWSSTRNARRGSALLSVLVITGIVAAACTSIAALSQYHVRKQHGRTASLAAFYTAENALLEGVQLIAETSNPVLQGPYTPTLPYDIAQVPGLESCTLKVEADPAGVASNYQLTAVATVRGKTRAIRALVRKNPPSTVFDYEYFLNNWGWWWGSSIHGYGDQRSNWDFDFRYNPEVNGHILANGNVESNMVPVDPYAPGGTPPFTGWAGNDPLTYCHTGSPRVKMPNLKNLAVYESGATGTVEINGVTIVNGVHGDDEAQSGIYLEGTAANPIEIDGRVVIRGDAIVKGYITGQGTLYVGGNLYIAGDVIYSNGPSFSSPPATMSASAQDSWVASAKSAGKDLIAFAVRESIFAGQVNSSTWKSGCYDASVYGLKNVGGETNLGADGIADTPDDGIAYLDTDGDGTPDSAWYDADEDGVVDANFNYANDIQMTTARRDRIARYPVNSSNQLIDYNTVASGSFTRFDGIYYTNHAMASRTSAGPDYLNGSLICRNEAWIFTNRLDFRYDPRVHSRYNQDPNNIIDLGLPVAESARMLRRYEIAPDEA